MGAEIGIGALLAASGVSALGNIAGYTSSLAIHDLTVPVEH